MASGGIGMLREPGEALDKLGWSVEAFGRPGEQSCEHAKLILLLILLILLNLLSMLSFSVILLILLNLLQIFR